jgi:AcrR family transcriptional regulator
MPGQKAAEGDRQEQILAAAMDVATRHGLEGLTIRRVAAEAGLSHDVVHSHFKSKAELLATLLDRLFIETAAFVAGPEITGIGASLQRLLALLQQEVCGESRVIGHGSICSSTSG